MGGSWAKRMRTCSAELGRRVRRRGSCNRLGLVRRRHGVAAQLHPRRNVRGAWSRGARGCSTHLLHAGVDELFTSLVPQPFAPRGGLLRLLSRPLRKPRSRKERLQGREAQKTEWAGPYICAFPQIQTFVERRAATRKAWLALSRP